MKLVYNHRSGQNQSRVCRLASGFMYPVWCDGYLLGMWRRGDLYLKFGLSHWRSTMSMRGSSILVLPNETNKVVGFPDTQIPHGVCKQSTRDQGAVSHLKYMVPTTHLKATDRGCTDLRSYKSQSDFTYPIPYQLQVPESTQTFLKINHTGFTGLLDKTIKRFKYEDEVIIWLIGDA